MIVLAWTIYAKIKCIYFKQKIHILGFNHTATAVNFCNFQIVNSATGRHSVPRCRESCATPTMPTAAPHARHLVATYQVHDYGAFVTLLKCV